MVTSKESQVIIKTQVLVGCWSSTVCEDDSRIRHHLRRSYCKEVIDIDATQGNYIMRQNLRGKTKLISRRLLEQSSFLSDEAKRFTNLREEDAEMLPPQRQRSCW